MFWPQRWPAVHLWRSRDFLPRYNLSVGEKLFKNNTLPFYLLASQVWAREGGV